MPTYTLIPDEHDFEPEELVADGPAELLSKVYSYGWNAARVLGDGTYLFTVSRSSRGVWSILPGLPALSERQQTLAPQSEAQLKDGGATQFGDDSISENPDLHPGEQPRI